MVPNVAIYCNKHNRWRTETLNNKTISKAIESEIHKYASENLAIINIFIKESYTKRFRKTEKMSRISYIASSGGLLGLCMGFSFVSLAEIAYHCFLCIVLLCRKKRAMFKKTQNQKKKRRQSSIHHRLEAAPPGKPIIYNTHKFFIDAKSLVRIQRYQTLNFSLSNKKQNCILEN